MSPSASTTSTSRRKRLAEAGMRLTARDRALLLAVYRYRQLVRADIERLVFPGLAHTDAWDSSVATRRLGLLVQHGYLVRRSALTSGEAGRPAGVYSAGDEAFALLCDELGLSETVVRHRIRQDARLSWMTFEHRRQVNLTRMTYERACSVAGYAFRWVADEDLAVLHEAVMVKGRRLSVAPDGFMVIGVPTTDGKSRTYAAFLEVQVKSTPSAYKEKLLSFRAYLTNGVFSRRWSLSTFRVLGIVDSSARAEHLREVGDAVGGGPYWWSATLADVVAGPWDEIWQVAGQGERRFRLLG